MVSLCDADKFFWAFNQGFSSLSSPGSNASFIFFFVAAAIVDVAPLKLCLSVLLKTKCGLGKCVNVF